MMMMICEVCFRNVRHIPHIGTIIADILKESRGQPPPSDSAVLFLCGELKVPSRCIAGAAAGLLMSWSEEGV
jgi:hypothetical protein